MPRTKDIDIRPRRTLNDHLTDGDIRNVISRLEASSSSTSSLSSALIP